MYTRILLINKYFKEKYNNNLLYRIVKKVYYNRYLKKTFNSIRENYFVFKYDNLIELYKLVEDTGSNKYVYIEDDDYLYKTLIIENPGIIKMRIDIGLDSHIIILTVNEFILKYELQYQFSTKLKYNMYHEDSKDKDQDLISLCNLLLIDVFINKLEYIYWGDDRKIKINKIIEKQHKQLINRLLEIDKTKIKE